MKVYYDFVEIIVVFFYVEVEFDIVFFYRIKEVRFLFVEIILIGIEGEECNEFKYMFMVLYCLEKM